MTIFSAGCGNRTPAKPLPPVVQVEDVKDQSDTRLKPYRFGIYTADSASTVMRQITPLTDSLEKLLGAEVQPYIFPDYEGGISGIATGEVDFMRLGAASYVIATEQNPGLHLLAMESKKGERTFKGVIAVHEDAAFTSLSELKGKRFAFGDKLSTVGRYLSQLELSNAGVGSAELASFDYLERHDKVGMAVAAKQFDAGALKSATFKSLKEDGQPLRELSNFDVVTKPWVARSDLEPERLQALRKALFELEPEQLKNLAKDGFLSAEDKYYDTIRKAIKASASF